MARHTPSLLSLLLGLSLTAQSTYAADAVPVVVAMPQQQTIYRQVKLTGTVTSPRVAQLSPAIQGLVLQQSADEGDHVEAGQVLLALDDELARHQLSSTNAQVSQAQTALEDARRRLKEAETLGPKGGLAQTLIDDLRAEVAQDKDILEQRRAEAAYQQALVERHQVKAPFAGLISRRLSELGEWVTPGQGVYELVAMDQLRLDFAVAEDFLAELSPNTAVQFSLNALPDKQLKGRVQTIVPVTDPGARTFLLRIVPEQPVTQMMPGMSARAELQVPTNREGLVVPRDALLRYPDGRVVIWTLSQTDSGPIANEKQVQTGQSFDGLVEIRQGLGSDEQVVMQGNEALQNGQRVRVIRSPTQ